MKRAAQILSLAVSAVLCAACARIHIEPKSDAGMGAGATGGAGMAATTGGGGTAAPAAGGGGGFSLPDFGTLFNPPPPVNGKWNVTFVVRGQPQDSTIDFSQNGKTLMGSGQDGDGHGFVLVNGTVDGKKVHFFKKYTDADPSKPMIEYNGELSYQNDQDFKGWSIGGHYKTNVNGQSVDDKWVAVSQATEQSQQPAQPQQPAQQPAQPPPDQQAQQPPADQHQQPEQASGGEQQQADTNGGGAQSADIPDDVTGTYTARYEFNFHPVETRLWLKQDKDTGKITGDGTDTNTHEYFVISKGVITTPPEKAPRMLLTFHYQKGVHANKDRDLTVHAVVGPGPSLRGETQSGSPWAASFVAH
ncbi:MAG TPA: hypothetical protein V6D22_06545 [Candidatus Obscuribacterales bacterium]